ncbi:hypothetical protein A2U01_0022912, partial [Trifolium medium]|nr:hypothetical protein [Trifolium medium]
RLPAQMEHDKEGGKTEQAKQEYIVDIGVEETATRDQNLVNSGIRMNMLFFPRQEMKKRRRGIHCLM